MLIRVVRSDVSYVKSIVGGRNLVLRHSVPHFPLNFQRNIFVAGLL